MSKKEEKRAAARETAIGFFTTEKIKEALEAEAKKSNRSRSRHLHAILAERYPKATEA